MTPSHSTQTLVECFNVLADEVQILSDRKTILEHKLRFAHEQLQYLADKHAPAAPEIAETLAKVQVPPEIHQSSLANAAHVPLPRRWDTSTQQDTYHQVALVIRDGRRAAQELSTQGDPSKTSQSSRDLFSGASHISTSMSTALEQDFTVEGKKGKLECPFSVPSGGSDANGHVDVGATDNTPHHSADPICAAMLEETTMKAYSPSESAAAKCPIRYLDQHSPEEIAHYVETHKHEIPRSHEVCVSRYQRNEQQIRKLDAKYGNLVSMIQGLSQLHKPMLPAGQQQADEIDRASNERVENWAQTVSVPEAQDPGNSHLGPEDDDQLEEAMEREGHFDRPLKEVRVGESPSRPWGISVPAFEGDRNMHPQSPPPAPVVPLDSVQGTPQSKTAGKCPFDHTKLAAMQAAMQATMQTPTINHEHPMPSTEERPDTGFTPPKQTSSPFSPPPQPAFINPPDLANQHQASGAVPQMVFTGPVFIGYPMEQALQFMNQYQGGR